MGRWRDNGWLFDGGWLIAWAAASAAWCLTAAGQLSATFDEPVYITRGLEGWQTGSHSGLLRLGTMPLPVDVSTLPLYLWQCWQGVELDPATDLPALLPWARGATLVFWFILLVYGMLVGRQLAGPWGGRLAVAWLAFEPNLLAHASLATTDIAISACLLALIYHFSKGRQGRWPLRIGVPALWFAAAMLSKASGLVYGPLCLLVVETERLLRNGSLKKAISADSGNPAADTADRRRLLGRIYHCFAPFRRDAVQVMAIGFTLMVIYCGCDWQPEPSFVAWAHELPEGHSRTTMLWVAEHLRIFSNAGEGLVRQIKHNVKGYHGSYLLGQSYPRAIWYYFPLALCIKLSLPLLIAPWVVAGLNRRALLNWAFLACVVLLLFSFTYKIQIGIRIVLPLVVLLVVGVSAGVVQAVRDMEGVWARRLLGAAATAAVVWTAFASLRVWPSGLCYTNELWGGTSNGYLYLSDSNYDWGQGLKELARWRQEQGLEELDVWYFGTDPAVDQSPLRKVRLHEMVVDKPHDLLQHVEGDFLAVSTTLLYGAYGPPAPRGTLRRWPAVEVLRRRQPVARTSTFLIYDMASLRAESSAELAAEPKTTRQRNRQ